MSAGSIDSLNRFLYLKKFVTLLLLMKIRNQYQLWEKLIFKACLGFLCFWTTPVFGQVQSVTTIQNLGFGAFSNGASGGTITVTSFGDRTSTGSVTLLNLGQPYSQALFDVVAPPGTIISITNGPDATLTGSNGGTMSLQLGVSDPASPIAADPSGTTRISLGGTLTIGNTATSPPGSYTGTFYITFNNQ
jgi:hypothetical protein